MTHYFIQILDVQVEMKMWNPHLYSFSTQCDVKLCDVT